MVKVITLVWWNHCLTNASPIVIRNTYKIKTKDDDAFELLDRMLTIKIKMAHGKKIETKKMTINQATSGIVFILYFFPLSQYPFNVKKKKKKKKKIDVTWKKSFTMNTPK